MVRRVIAGTVYSARGANGRSVAIKVININGLPMSSQKMVQVYLNEVALLGRLQQESDHVVVIYDFDFDAQRGLGECTTFLARHLHPRHGSFSVHRHGVRWRESRLVDLSGTVHVIHVLVRILVQHSFGTFGVKWSASLVHSMATGSFIWT